MDKRRKKYIYCILVLKEYIRQLVGINYPKEIIKLIIMCIYRAIQISCGACHNILFSDKIYVWGSNNRGQLGLGHTKSRLSPRELKFSEPIKSISSGWCHNIALTYVPNELYSWGYNGYGQLGLGHNDNQLLPQKLRLSVLIESISCGANHTIALINNDKVLYVWGNNAFGQLGLGDENSVNSPHKLVLCESIISVTCGELHTVALVKCSNHLNKLYVWGDNNYGQLGLGDRKCQYSPHEIDLHQIIISINCGWHNTFVLTNRNEVYVWGYNYYGQLGLGHNKSVRSPQKLVIDELIKTITCSSNHTIILTKTGRCYVCGDHLYEKLYSNIHKKNCSLKRIKFREPIMSVSCENEHTIVVTQSEKIYVWGRNSSGQLGLGHKNNKFSIRELKF